VSQTWTTPSSALRQRPVSPALGDRGWTFLCPNGTIFNQKIFTCVWWFDFNCEEAEGLYGLNEGLYESEGGEGVEGGEEVEQPIAGLGGVASSGSGSQGGQSGGVVSKPGQILPVISEIDEDNSSGYEEDNLSGYEEDKLFGFEEDTLSGHEEDTLSGYIEQVSVSGPTPAPVQPDRLYGAPRVGRRRSGRR
jgi:hypothetical protein